MSRLRGVLLLSLLVLAADWGSKYAGRAWSHGWIYNTDPGGAWALPCVAALVAVCLLVLRGPLVVWACGIALGGCLGNMLDVWLRGVVLDFIPCGWVPWLPADSICNAADGAIALGSALLAAVAVGLIAQTRRPAATSRPTVRRPADRPPATRLSAPFRG